jgi:transcriptional regulator GlxA family with amidase domain
MRAEIVVNDELDAIAPFDVLSIAARSATTHRAARDAMAGYGARLVDARVVDDNDIVSSAGVTSLLDLALWLVERFFGAVLAAAVPHQIASVRHGPIWQAAG